MPFKIDSFFMLRANLYVKNNISDFSFKSIVDGTIRKFSNQIDVPENEGTRRKVVTESILAASRIIELRKILPFSWKFAETFEGTLNKDLIKDVQSKINTIFSDNVTKNILKKISCTLVFYCYVGRFSLADKSNRCSKSPK